MNPLRSNDGKSWISDGSQGATLDVASGEGDGTTIVTLSPAEGSGEPFNIYLLDDNLIPEQSMYYEVEIISGDVSMGIVAKDEFRKGYGITGMFYHGNVSDGSGGLIIGFGDCPSDGDKVGVYLLRTGEDDDNLRLVIYQNGRCLGSAFYFGGWRARDTFYPCLHANNRSVVKVTFPEAFPTQINRQPKKRDDVYSGDWNLKQAFNGGTCPDDVFSLDGVGVTFHFKKERSDDDEPSNPGIYRLSASVGNTLNTCVEIVGKNDEGYDQIKIGMGLMTLMGLEGRWAEVEDFVFRSLDGVDKMMVSDESGDLVMKGENVQFVFRRYEKNFEPSEGYKPLPPRRTRIRPPMAELIEKIGISNLGKRNEEEEEDKSDDSDDGGSNESTENIYEEDSLYQEIWGAFLSCQKLSKVKNLVNQNPSVLEDKDDYGTLLLHYACCFNPKYDIIKFLVEKNPNALFEFDAANRTPLYLACDHCAKLDVIKYLIELDPEAVKIDIHGNTPLHVSCSKGSMDVIWYLTGKYPQAWLLRDCHDKLPLDYAKKDFRWEEKKAHESPLALNSKNKEQLDEHRQTLDTMTKLTASMARVLNDMLWSEKQSTLERNVFEYMTTFMDGNRHEPDEITAFRTAFAPGEVNKLLSSREDIGNKIREQAKAIIQEADVAV